MIQKGQERGSEGARTKEEVEEDGRCERLMRESEKLILTLLWAGRLRKIREIE